MVFDSKIFRELFFELNSTFHYPVIFPLIIKGGSTDIYKWTNDYLIKNLNLGSVGSATQAYLPSEVQEQLGDLFGGIKYNEIFNLQAMDGRKLQGLLFSETRLELSGRKQKQFDLVVDQIKGEQSSSPSL